ncbi:hypothetical protein Gohar_027404 [Gossypium harknessii]|uniref:Hydrophobic seed protein domain-containing protein n=1 Tax=Gossypium harknessii TaxID=34285 RepID=A0A7J9HW36_9ROSI|nr:hypothetical protein [Gossypium harknessii]
MASKVKPSTALFFSLNLFFVALVSSYNVDNNPNGSSYPTKSRNPVVIRPGYKFPNDGSAQSYYGTCNPLNLGVCVNLLGGLVNLDLGNVPTQPCCSLIHGLADLESAVCLCTAVRANHVHRTANALVDVIATENLKKRTGFYLDGAVPSHAIKTLEDEWIREPN